MTSPRVESLTGISKSPPLASDLPKRVLVIFGTRPEAIKLAPLITALRGEPFAQFLQPIICVTGQHREMVDQVLRAFEIRPDFDLQLMQHEQSLNGLAARLVGALEPVFAESQPSLAVVQGDTTTTLCAALSGFYAGKPVAHVEAGLRTCNLSAPFPEEMHRVLTTRLASLHFAATEGAAENLLREGIARQAIEVTGNTGVDAVLSIRARLESGVRSGLAIELDESKKLIVVTAHRRESFGSDFDEICRAIAELSERDDVQIVWPVHRNPNVLRSVEAALPGRANVILTEPLDYLPFVDLMRRAYLLITDSGGIQEEAPSFGKPVLVLRERTERPEAIAAGTALLVGTSRSKIVGETVRLLENQAEYLSMARLHNSYGDGQASLRIARRIASFLEIPLP